MKSTWVLEMIRDRDCKTQCEIDAMNRAIQALSQPEKRTEERTETHSCDLISRQDAIEWCLEGLNNMPSAHERKTGRWIDKDGGIATCSVCGDRWGVWSVMKYCPNCGCRMMEVEHE